MQNHGLIDWSSNDLDPNFQNKFFQNLIMNLHELVMNSYDLYDGDPE